ncbi:ATP-dependent nuclease [Actinomadura hibisca]|uniref:ATP-dependent nuclease n=1 Tax=Actinomadura hibisca TaxID=68565 RepID=UPI00082A044F|nr:AAA family ATPase [Actinomadura hibisca]
MRLDTFSVTGFRSLQKVADIPVSSPTILAGHNDGGKSAVLGALEFLLGEYKLTDEDRTYALPERQGHDASVPSRCEATIVEGLFSTDEWERQVLRLPEELKMRRRAGEDLDATLEYWIPVPADERLHDLTRFTAVELKALAKELGLRPASQRRADLEVALRAYAMENATRLGWSGVPSDVEKRLPQVLSFEGGDAKPDDAVRGALMGRFRTHVRDEQTTAQIQEIEAQVQDRLRIDAKSLCDHIRTRCPDLNEVFVDPRVSFKHGFEEAALKIARTTGEPVSLKNSGLGSSRRISLAIWEWTMELLEAEEAESEQSPPQTIVVYDEPDTHLDYRQQRQIMQLIRDQSALPHVNVMVATHSMNLIDGVDIAGVVNLRLENDRTVMERLDADTHEGLDLHLQQIAASLGLRNSVLLHERCFLAVEGETEQQAIPILFRLSEGLSLQAAGIALWACSNNEGALHLAGYLAKHGRSVMLMVDADSRSAPKGIFKTQRLVQYFGKDVANYVKFVGEPAGHSELEELFPDSQWAAVANQIWPKTALWTPQEFAVLRGQGKFSSKVLEMLKSQSEDGPGGKPEMMYRLAVTLKGPEDVPAQFREVFAELRKMAG